MPNVIDQHPLVVNRYYLLERIGQGAMGQVYRAKDTRLGKIVAVKFLVQRLFDQQMCDRFATEAIVSALLSQQSIHIVGVTDYGVTDDDQPFYVMEYLRGSSLKRLIAEGALPFDRFLYLTRQICLGLQVAHRGIVIEPNPHPVPIVHRDIKPSNIFVCPDLTTGELVKVLDFGIAEVLRDTNRPDRRYMGTAAYSSPEQLESNPVDQRSDIYSLGIMMFEMLTGQLPLYATTPNFNGWYQAHTQHAPLPLQQVAQTRLPPELTELVMACLAKQSSDRPQSITDLLNVLEPLMADHPVSQNQPPPVDETVIDQTLVDDELPSSVASFHPLLWPEELVPSPIVVPRAISIAGRGIASKWVMLPHHMIQTLQIYRLYNRIYHTVLFAQSPYPALLWVTAIHNPRLGAKWFRAILDLKSAQGLEIGYGLLNYRKYDLLFFDLEPPYVQSHSIEIPLNSNQYSELQHWIILSRTQTPLGRFDESKRILNDAYLKLKTAVTEANFSQPSYSADHDTVIQL